MPTLHLLPLLLSRSRAATFSAIALLAFAFSAVSARAQFTISGTTTSSQTLASGTGTVTSTGTLSVSGTNNAVNVTGTSSLVNNGTIKQSGTGRAIRDNAGGLTFTITNNADALIQAADGDAFQMNKANSNVTMDNFGSVISLNASAGGAQAIDWNAITTGSNILRNHTTGILQATAADAVRPGVNGVIINDGQIKALPVVDTSSGARDASSSDGIDAQFNTGVQITNSGAISGRHGITGGETQPNFTISVTNNVGGTITGVNGSGINIDGANTSSSVVSFATVLNNGTIIGNHDATKYDVGDGDGVDVDGTVNLTNNGIIRGVGASGNGSDGLGNNSEGVSIGGGTIVNNAGAQITGENPTGAAEGHGILVDNSSNGPAFAATSITNAGLIQGKQGFGIKLVGDWADTINNQAGGVIEGGKGSTASTYDPVIDMGGGNDTMINAGSVISDGGNSATAIALGAGDDHLTISGASASIIGGIDGGSGGETTGDRLTFDLGSAGATFAHSGVISNFEQVEVLSGKVTLNGNNTYAGTTTIGGGAISASLAVNGVHAGGGAYRVMNNGLLTGTGTLNLASASTLLTIDHGGTFRPGDGKFTIGQGSMQVNGALSFGLNGPTAGTGGYGKLVFGAANTGNVFLGSGSSLNLDFGFTPFLGEQFTLIDLLNDSSSIVGTFDGLADGSFFTDNGYEFQINYHGGTGNDLVVSTIAAIPEPATTGLVMLSVSLVGAVALGRRRARAKELREAERR